jgi:hypothetical protein
MMLAYFPRTASFNPPTAFSLQFLVAKDLPRGFFHGAY